MAWKSHFANRAAWIVGTVLIVAGCQEQEQIRSYTVAKDPAVRLVAVIVPRDDSTWFFKLMGPAPEVAKHVEAFDRFVASVRFPKRGKTPIEWKVPDDWDEEHGDTRFYALVRYGGEGMPLPITITQLGPRAGGVRANIDRWRVKQLGLEPIDDAALKKLEDNIMVDGTKATRVDFVGQSSGRASRPVAAPPPAPVADVRPFTYSKPADWEELPSGVQGGIAFAAVFRIESGGTVARTTILRLAGNGGGDLPNVNRWRGDLGLEPWDEKQFDKEVRSLETRSGRARYVEMTGGEGPSKKSTRAAWLSGGGQTWFLTMKGPAELVERQRGAFEAFVKSFRLEGGAGVVHE